MLVLKALLRLLDAVLPVHGSAHHLLLKVADLLLDLKLCVVVDGALVNACLEVLWRMTVAHLLLSHEVVVMGLDSELDLFGLFVVGFQLLFSKFLLLLVAELLALLD
jgi:hypothetical protein